MESKKEFLRKIVKKKRFLFAVAVVILIAGAAAFLIVVKGKMGKTQEKGTESVQSIDVQKGNISNTIDVSGNLESAETIDVTVPLGVKVEKITVESGDEVTKGQTLAKLNKASVTSLLLEVQKSLDSIEDELDDSDLSEMEEEVLEDEKNELESVEEELTALRKNPVITASAAGVIGDINVAADEVVSQDTSSLEKSDSDSDNTKTSQMSSANNKENDSQILLLTADISDSDESDEDNESDNSGAEVSIVDDYSKLSVTAPVTGAAPQNTIEETSMYEGKITWNCSGKTFQAQTEYTATIILTAKSGYIFSEKNLPIIREASFNWNIYNSGSNLKIVAKYEKTAEIQNNQGNSSNTSKDSTVKKSSEKASPNTANASGGKAGSVSGGSSQSGSSGSTASAGSSSEDYYSNYKAVAFTIEKRENATIVASVDELDILSVEEKQTAVITLDALEGEEYEGTVTKVATSATAGNGSTKYEVEITVPMDDNMRIGMSASATIEISEAENTLMIPMTALQQRGEETFVYTSKDEDGNLSGEVTVETGLSDGQNVEIVSGLEEGDTVYYTRTSDNDDKSSEMKNGFMGGGMGESLGDRGGDPGSDGGAANSGGDTRGGGAHGFGGRKSSDN